MMASEGLMMLVMAFVRGGAVESARSKQNKLALPGTAATACATAGHLTILFFGRCHLKRHFRPTNLALFALHSRRIT